MSDWMKKMLESKRTYRAKLVALPFEEKLKLLEQLRQRSLLIGTARSELRQLLPSTPNAGIFQ